jgi:hypothetical protein
MRCIGFSIGFSFGVFLSWTIMALGFTLSFHACLIQLSFGIIFDSGTSAALGFGGRARGGVV